jgi:tight adherence protein B
MIGSLQEQISTLTIFALPMAGGAMLAYGLYQLWHDLRKPEQKRLQQRLREQTSVPLPKNKSGHPSILRKIPGQQKKRADVLLSRYGLVNNIQRTFSQAGVDWSASRFLVNTCSVGMLVAVLLAISNTSVIIAVGLGILVPVAPLMFMAFKSRARKKKLNYQLPDVFDLLCQALRAGHSLASGIQLIGQQLPDPVGIEFRRCFHEQNLGVKLEEALRNMADRVDVLDLSFFVTAVAVQRQTGGDLAEILDKISNVIRDRIKILGQVKSLTAEGRLSGWVLSALPVFVFFVAKALNPEYIDILLHEPDGQAMLRAAIVMQIMGMLMIKKIVNIKI